MPPPRAAFDLAQQRGFNIDTSFSEPFARSLPKVANGTRRARDATAYEFQEFLQKSQKWSPEKIDRYLSDDAPPFEVNIFKNFLFYWAAKSKGKLDKKDRYPSQDTTFRKWKNLSGWLAHRTGKQISKKVFDDMSGFLDNKLTNMLPIKKVFRPKDNTDEVDYDILMNQHWCLDIFIHTHKRHIIQVPLVIHMLYFFGIQRIGAFLATCDYPDLALRYRDIEFLVDRRTDTHEPILRVQFSSHYMKGRKETDDWTGTVQNEQRRFQDCSVMLFLILAFVDNVFDGGIDTPEKLLNIQPLKDRVRRIPVREDMKDCYIFTSERGNPLSDTVFRRYYGSMVRRAGYDIERMNLYNIRRGVLNKVKDLIPATRLLQTMGHRSEKEVLKSYLSKIADIDFQGLVLRGEQDPGIDYSRVLRSERGLRPPTELPASIKKDIEESLAGVPVGTKNYKRMKRSLTQDAWSKFLEAWHNRINLEETGSQKPLSSHIPDSCEMEGDLMLQEIRAKILLGRFSLDFPEISDAFHNESFDIRQSQHLNVIKRLMHLIRHGMQKRAFWYPGGFPIYSIDRGKESYACSVCSKDLTSFTDYRARPKHIHRCQQLQRRKHAHYEPRHCYRCHIWFSDRSSYQDHCRRHYMDLDMYCGLWIEGLTVIVAARCPFCLSPYMEGAEWDEIVVEFTDTASLQRHLRAHFSRLSHEAMLPCPHPLCDNNSLLSHDELVHHFCDSHGYDYDHVKEFQTSLQPSTGIIGEEDVGQGFRAADGDPTRITVSLDQPQVHNTKTGRIEATSGTPAYGTAPLPPAPAPLQVEQRVEVDLTLFKGFLAHQSPLQQALVRNMNQLLKSQESATNPTDRIVQSQNGTACDEIYDCVDQLRHGETKSGASELACSKNNVPPSPSCHADPNLVDPAPLSPTDYSCLSLAIPLDVFSGYSKKRRRMPSPLGSELYDTNKRICSST